jgi:hypothetical protein
MICLPKAQSHQKVIQTNADKVPFVKKNTIMIMESFENSLWFSSSNASWLLLYALHLKICNVKIHDITDLKKKTHTFREIM